MIKDLFYFILSIDLIINIFLYFGGLNLYPCFFLILNFTLNLFGCFLTLIFYLIRLKLTIRRRFLSFYLAHLHKSSFFCLHQKVIYRFCFPIYFSCFAFLCPSFFGLWRSKCYIFTNVLKRWINLLWLLIFWNCH